MPAQEENKQKKKKPKLFRCAFCSLPSGRGWIIICCRRAVLNIKKHEHTHTRAHTELVISLSLQATMTINWPGHRLPGSINTISGFNCEGKEGKGLNSHSHNFSYLGLKRRVNGWLQSTPCICHNSILCLFVCLLNATHRLHRLRRLRPFPPQTTQQSYLASSCCQREWSIFVFISCWGPGPRPWVWSRAGAPGDKADRDTATCVSAVRVGTDGSGAAIKQLPLPPRSMDQISITQLWRHTAQSVFKGTVCLKRPREGSLRGLAGSLMLWC